MKKSMKAYLNTVLGSSSLVSGLTAGYTDVARFGGYASLSCN